MREMLVPEFTGNLGDFLGRVGLVYEEVPGM
jgi:hypothetical protein